MEYSSQSSTLGNSQIQGVLVSSLNGEKYNVEKKETKVVFEPTGHFFKPLAVNSDFGFIDTSNNDDNEEYVKDEDKNENDDKEETDNRFQFVKDPINSFFIGSITVVGLFVLYRLLQKNK